MSDPAGTTSLEPQRVLAAGEPKIEKITVAAFRVPTDAPESDGTFEWDATTIIVVHATAGGRLGLGYTYTDAAAAGVVERVLRPAVVGRSAFAVPECWAAMRRAV